MALIVQKYGGTSVGTVERIQNVARRVARYQAEGHQVIVVAGFQGVDEANNITTLGRGGSDTTGVALAAALHADECQIFTDVDGVYTTDPVSYTHLRAHETDSYLVCRLLL